MDKNPNKEKIVNVFNNSINSILCYDAFVKEAIIIKIIKEYSLPIIYVDFDLLYTGYVKSGMIENDKNVVVFNPKKENWDKILKEIIIKISRENCVLIIDSLNGFFSIFDGKDAGRYANSCMMILSSLVKNTKGKIFLNSIAKLKENEGWILYPTGRHILENKSISKFFVNNTKQLEILSNDNKIEKIIKI